MSRRQALASLAAGLACLVAAPFVWSALQPEPAGETVTTINAAAAGALVSSAPAGSSGAPESPAEITSSAGPVAATTSAAPAPVASDAALAASQEVPASIGAPVRITVPTLGVDTDVIPVGVDATGGLEIPENVNEIGWYKFGPAPGAIAGSAVLTGHVDSSQQGPGAFAELGDVTVGDIITVRDELGVERTFSVLAREEWPKSEVPLDRIFDRTGSPRLVLITCGGSFDSSSLHYDDNIAITAVPVAA